MGLRLELRGLQLECTLGLGMIQGLCGLTPAPFARRQHRISRSRSSEVNPNFSFYNIKYVAIVFALHT